MLHESVEGDSKASVEDPEEGGPQNYQDAQEEDPELGQDCRTIDGNSNHCSGEQSQKNVLKKDPSFDIFLVLGSDSMDFE